MLVEFTLQDGVYQFDHMHILQPNFDKRYIDQSAIRRPADTLDNCSYTSKYHSIRIYVMCKYFCLPYSSNVNLLHPDIQCQFNRIDILLCSQYPHPLSMVFGSSRCVKCTNLHIFITIVRSYT